MASDNDSPFPGKAKSDDAESGAKKYERLNPWNTGLHALLDDDDETAGRKSGSRTQKRRFAVTAIKAMDSADKRQRAKKKLEGLAQDIAKQLGLEGMFSPEALARIADRVKRDKVNNEQQIVMLAAGQMPSGVPGWLEHEIRKQKANVEYQVMAANPAMLRILMQNAPQALMQQIAQRIGFVADVVQKDWVQDFLAADKRERAIAAEMEKKNRLDPVRTPDLVGERMRHIPGVLDMNLHTGLKALDWANMRTGLTLAGAFAASTRDMHGLMNPVLRQDAALKIYEHAPVTKPFAEADMSLRETKMLYSKLHMKGFDDGQIARTAHVAVALAQVRKDIDPRANSREGDFQRNVYNNIVKDLRASNQNEIVKPPPVEKVASYVGANADALRTAITSKYAASPADISQLALRTRQQVPLDTLPPTARFILGKDIAAFTERSRQQTPILDGKDFTTVAGGLRRQNLVSTGGAVDPVLGGRPRQQTPLPITNPTDIAALTARPRQQSQIPATGPTDVAGLTARPRQQTSIPVVHPTQIADLGLRARQQATIPTIADVAALEGRPRQQASAGHTVRTDDLADRRPGQRAQRPDAAIGDVAALGNRRREQEPVQKVGGNDPNDLTGRAKTNTSSIKAASLTPKPNNRKIETPTIAT